MPAHPVGIEQLVASYTCFPSQQVFEGVGTAGRGAAIGLGALASVGEGDGSTGDDVRTATFGLGRAFLCGLGAAELLVCVGFTGAAAALTT
jgi:hypothetical protein